MREHNDIIDLDLNKNEKLLFDYFCNKYIRIVESMKENSHTHNDGTLNPYHQEGDIWTHTLMVLSNKNENDSINTFLAKLLHDIGKPITRHEGKNSRVKFFNHENVSMWNSIDILKEMYQVFPQLEIDVILVLKLINAHSYFQDISRGTSTIELSEEKTRSMNHQFGNDIKLYQEMVLMTKSDTFGRIMPEDDELNLMIQYELLENFIPVNIDYKENKPSEVVLLIGPSCSGKSTYLKNNFNNYTILSVDDEVQRMNPKKEFKFIDYKKDIKKAHNKIIQKMEQLAKDGVNVVIDMTNTDIKSRRKRLSRFPSNIYNKKAIVFLVGEKQLIKNISKRKEKEIPVNVLLNQIETFQLPSYEEFNDIEYILI
jgi:predicted kinase